MVRQEPSADGARSYADQAVQHHTAVHLQEAKRLYQLGNVLATQGKIDQAVVYYERALSLKPDYSEAHNNLGNALATQGKTDQAMAHYQRAVALQPNFAAAHNNLGNALVLQGKTDQAVAHFERALSLKPDDAEAHNNLGCALTPQGKTDQAIAHYQKAVALQPNYAAAHHNLGNALVLQGQMSQAVAHYQRALSLKPDDAEAHNSLGSALAMQGKIDQAVAHYQRAVSLWPDNVAAHNSLLLTLNYASDKDPVVVYAAHLDFARKWEAPLAPMIQAHLNDRSRGRRLKIGYVSSDLKQHSVVYFIEPVLAHHDHERFEIFCYFNHFQEDAVTVRLKSHADHWRDIYRLSDELAANQIRADQIDILIDLNGHTASNRLLVFARKPAPVQVTWLGYPNTTGLSAMDYRLTDGFADPLGMTEHLHSEKLIRLPECFSCYKPPQDAPEVSGLPAREKGYITFGSFNNLAKITPEVMTTWAKVLQAVPRSRLTLKNPALGETITQQTMRKAFAELGITPERLELLGLDRSQRAHLERYWSIDIGLDPFPYNGTTTTCDALWMGVPIVTLAGRTHAGRVGVSQMSNLGLTELIGNTPEAYIAAASRLATDWEHLSALRQGLRSRMATSPLMNASRFTKNLEQAYLTMWNDWCLKTSGGEGVVIE